MTISDAAGRFWRQPNSAYRDFQAVYSAITLNFALPAASYYLDRDATRVRAEQIARRFGDPDLPATEDSDIWWILGAGNVAALAFMCAFLQRDLPRNRHTLTPLVFLKMASAIGYVGVGLARRRRFFFAVAALDSLTSLAMWFFARRALAAIDAAPPGENDALVPMPPSLRPADDDADRDAPSTTTPATPS